MHIQTHVPTNTRENGQFHAHVHVELYFGERLREGREGRGETGDFLNMVAEAALSRAPDVDGGVRLCDLCIAVSQSVAMRVANIAILGVRLVERRDLLLFTGSDLTSDHQSPLLYTFHVSRLCVRHFRFSATVLSLVPRASSWTAAPRAAVQCRAQSASAAPCFRHMLRTRWREADC